MNKTIKKDANVIKKPDELRFKRPNIKINNAPIDKPDQPNKILERSDFDGFFLLGNIL